MIFNTTICAFLILSGVVSLVAIVILDEEKNLKLGWLKGICIFLSICFFVGIIIPNMDNNYYETIGVNQIYLSENGDDTAIEYIDENEMLKSILIDDVDFDYYFGDTIQIKIPHGIAMTFEDAKVYLPMKLKSTPIFELL